MSSDAHEVDAATGTTTTGHEWDGIRELNTPLPRWWLWTFYACILWAVGYWLVYPAWPLVSGYTRGMIGYSSRAEVAVELATLKQARLQQAAELADASLAEIAASPDMLRIAMAQGKAAFGDNCAACHGSGAAGARGFPNLLDDDWLWGGSPETILATITHGIRSPVDADTRQGQMLAFGRDGVLKPEEIRTVANYVRSLAGLSTEPGSDRAAGTKLFADNCAACHGPAGKGNQELGAPNLTDAIWLYGSDIGTIVETVTNGRAGVMPAWGGRLDATTLKALAVYVHSLGGGS